MCQHHALSSHAVTRALLKDVVAVLYMTHLSGHEDERFSSWQATAAAKSPPSNHDAVLVVAGESHSYNSQRTTKTRAGVQQTRRTSDRELRQLSGWQAAGYAVSMFGVVLYACARRRQPGGMARVPSTSSIGSSVEQAPEPNARGRGKSYISKGI